jgi:hypothetical protein
LSPLRAAIPFVATVEYHIPLRQRICLLQALDDLIGGRTMADREQVQLPGVLSPEALYEGCVVLEQMDMLPDIVGDLVGGVKIVLELVDVGGGDIEHGDGEPLLGEELGHLAAHRAGASDPYLLIDDTVVVSIFVVVDVAVSGKYGLTLSNAYFMVLVKWSYRV